MQIYSLYGNQHHQKPTPQPQRVLPTMSTPNTRFSGMIARSRGSSGGRHGKPADNTGTDGMIACTSGNRSIHHGYLANNAISSHIEPTNSAITYGKPKTVYVGKNQYHISIIQLAEVLEIYWKEKTGFDLIASSVVSLSGSHSMSDLIMFVDNELPMYT